MSLWFPAYFVLAMFASAFNSKALGLCIVFAIGLMAVYPETEKGSLLTLLFVPAYIVASFRD